MYQNYLFVRLFVLHYVLQSAVIDTFCCTKFIYKIMKGNLMGKKIVFVGTFMAILVLASCGGDARTKSTAAYTTEEVDRSNRVMQYYDTSLSLLKHVAAVKDVNAVLGYMEEGGKAPKLSAIAPPTFSQKDSAIVVNPGEYFNEETQRNLKQNYKQLFQAQRRFYNIFDQYQSYLKANNKSAADKLLPVNYQLSIEMAEYKQNIFDILSPFTDEARKVLLNDNPMKEQLLYTKRITATMQSILNLCMRKPTPDMVRLDTKMAKLVIQLDIAKRLPVVEGHPQEMQDYRAFLANAEAFVKDVKRIKSEGNYTGVDMATLTEYGMSLN